MKKERAIARDVTCTPAIPNGGYHFLVMPFVLNCAPEDFQRTMGELFETEEDINPYFDELLMADSSSSEHCSKLRRVLEVARKAN